MSAVDGLAGRVRAAAPFGTDAGVDRSLLLLFPLIAYELLFFVAPFLILLRISLAEPSTAGAYASGTWSIQPYVDVLTSEFFLGVIAYSFKLGVISTVITVALGTFYAYAIWRASGLYKSLLLFSIVLPLLTTLVIKTYAWLPLLAPTGTVNDLLLAANVLSSPVQFAPNTPGVVLGEVYIVLPYAVLAIYSVLSTMDWTVVEAARDLGASRPRSFAEVVLPQAIPGIAVGTVVTFAWSVGAYAAPALLGAGSDRTFAIEVESQMLSNFNWSVGTAFAVIMLVLMFVSSLALFNLLNRWGGEVEYGA
ncbi:ABC transporter permease [Halobacteriales archaeon QS_5_70_17]|nr:MAG: ABC transporter permease [Halobacteriales archaeon QS_5_70_17]